MDGWVDGWMGRILHGHIIVWHYWEVVKGMGVAHLGEIGHWVTFWRIHLPLASFFCLPSTMKKRLHHTLITMVLVMSVDLETQAKRPCAEPSDTKIILIFSCFCQDVLV